MNSPMTKMEAQDLLDKVARKSKAKEILASGSSYTILPWVSMIAVITATFALSDFIAPMPVKILISMSFGFSILSQFDTWRLQRRLDAAIELLQQAEDARG
jgi:hypothetical protein